MKKSTKIISRLLAAAAISISPLAMAPAAAQIGTPAATAAAIPANWYHRLVDAEFVKQYAVVPQRSDVLIVDARPTARKYDGGHIPTAISLPEAQFDKLAPILLPKDKSQLLIFYCEGPECILSHNAAFAAEKLGYTNIRVYAEGFPDWIKRGNLHAVSVAHIKKLMDAGSPMVLIDSRPKERKYDKGHIPGAISLPDTQFEKLAAERLPADKATPLFFYCEGLTCTLSNESAQKATKLGYTNVKVVPEGYPAWEKAYGAGPTSGMATASAPVFEAGKEKGSLTVASFEKIYKEAPDSVHLIDIRDSKEFATGSFKGAINLPLRIFDDNIAKLPSDKPIIFFCGAGSRSAEAYDETKKERPELKVWFLDATIKWTASGEYTIKQN